MDRDEIYDRFVAHGTQPSELLKLSIEQSWNQIDRDEDSPPMAEIVEAVYAIALEDDLHMRYPVQKRAITVCDGTSLANPTVVEVVVLEHDGTTIAYRYSSDAQDEDWQLGTPEDAAKEAVACYLAVLDAEGQSA